MKLIDDQTLFYLLIILVLVILFFWNKKRIHKSHKTLKSRNFKNRYQEKKRKGL